MNTRLFSCALGALLLPSLALALDPPPGGGYPGDNTALGDGVMLSDSPGSDNTGVGFEALMNAVTGCVGNTAVGSYALISTTSGEANVGIGWNSLGANTTGSENCAIGVNALVANTTGAYNVAVGEEALQAHQTGGDNVAVGPGAMALGTRGDYNTAVGSNAMTFSNGNDNVAVGDGALNAANGDENIGIGQQAALNTSGDNNIAIGQYAGQKLTTGSNNILLGASAGLSILTGSNNIEVATQGDKRDKGVIRLGDPATQKQTYIAGISRATISGGVAVMVSSTGQLGVATSSARFKEDIHPMKEASEALLALQPVTFRYKKELDEAAIPQFGLVAEQVAKVAPDLVIRDEAGKPFTVRYEAVNAMLLNEFLKEHRQVSAQAQEITGLKAAGAKEEATIGELKRSLAQQQAQIKGLSDGLQRVSAQLQSKQDTPRLVSVGE